MNDMLAGKLVRLGALDPEEVGRAFSTWSRDSEFWRLIAPGPARAYSSKDLTKTIEKEIEELEPNVYSFGVRTLVDDKLIGEINLEVVNWSGRDAFLGINIGQRENWGKGYGTEMMKLMLHFAFTEINLRRVTLTVFEYNPRAIHTYEKVGFRHEGRLRKLLNRAGRRWDMLYMGILREEWLEMQNENTFL